MWCALIFGASADKSSGEHTSRFIAPLIRFLVPDVSEDLVDAVVHYIRKTAHVSEYAVLALLLWHALRQAGKPDSAAPNATIDESRGWSWRIAALAFALAAFYAMTDEFHQSFVPTRSAQVYDVLIDASGAALGLFGLWFVGRWRKHW